MKKKEKEKHLLDRNLVGEASADVAAFGRLNDNEDDEGGGRCQVSLSALNNRWTRWLQFKFKMSPAPLLLLFIN